MGKVPYARPRSGEPPHEPPEPQVSGAVVIVLRTICTPLTRHLHIACHLHTDPTSLTHQSHTTCAFREVMEVWGNSSATLKKWGSGRSIGKRGEGGSGAWKPEANLLSGFPAGTSPQTTALLGMPDARTQDLLHHLHTNYISPTHQSHRTHTPIPYHLNTTSTPTAHHLHPNPTPRANSSRTRTPMPHHLRAKHTPPTHQRHTIRTPIPHYTPITHQPHTCHPPISGALSLFLLSTF